MNDRSKRALMGAGVAFSILGLGGLVLGGCAADNRTCYKSVEHHEYGRVLKAVPCEPGETSSSY